MPKSRTLWIVRTGIFLALLIVLQWATKPLTPLVTGSVVNFLLIASTLTAGLWSGVAIGVFSPLLAYLLGIVATPPYLLPVVMLANAALVLAYHFLLKRGMKSTAGRRLVLWTLTILTGSVLKFGVLYAGINWLVLPLLTTVTGAAVKAPAALFSAQQLLTAAVGGLLALAVVPPLLKAIRAV